MVIAGVLYAGYGTAANGSCQTGFSLGTCGASFLAYATKLCVGLPSCVVPLGSVPGLSDPCPGTPKSVTVAARCARPLTAAVAVDFNGALLFSQFVQGSGFSVRVLPAATGLLAPFAGGLGTMSGGTSGAPALLAGVDLVGGIDVDASGALLAGASV